MTLPSPMPVLFKTVACAPIQTPLPTEMRYVSPLARAPGVTPDPVSACQKGDVRGNVTVVADRDRPVSGDCQVASDPAIRADAERSGVMNGPDDLGIVADLIADGAQKAPFGGKETRPRQSMVDHVEHNPCFDRSQLHFLYQSSRNRLAGLQGPSANSFVASRPSSSACDSCKKRSAAVSAFHRPVMVR